MGGPLCAPGPPGYPQPVPRQRCCEVLVGHCVYGVWALNVGVISGYLGPLSGRNTADNAFQSIRPTAAWQSLDARHMPADGPLALFVCAQAVYPVPNCTIAQCRTKLVPGHW